MEEELGLDVVSFEYRSYDPAIGRFLQEDPKSEKYYGISPYSYTANNPIYLIDPRGEDNFKEC